MNLSDLIDIQNTKASKELRTLRGSIINTFLTLFSS